MNYMSSSKSLSVQYLQAAHFKAVVSEGKAVHEKLTKENVYTMKRNSMTRNLTVEQLKEFKAAFDKFDRNKDGLISRDEIKKAIEDCGREASDGEIDDMMKTVDLNKDGMIDFGEFTIMMQKKVKECMAKSLRDLFKALDRDGSGSLNKDELREALSKLGCDATDEEIEQMIEVADKNNDGSIDAEEFIEVMSSR